MMMKKLLIVVLLMIVVVSFTIADSSSSDDFWDSVDIVTQQPQQQEEEEVVATEDVVVEKKKEVVIPPKKKSMDEDFDDFDDDEDTISTPATEKEEVEEQPQVPQQPIKMFGLPEQEHFYYEYALISLFTLYLVVYVIGKAQNGGIIDSFTQNTGKIWTKNFSNIFRFVFERIKDEKELDDEESVLNTKLPLVSESASEYHLYCTGRSNVAEGCLVKINLKQRHDMFWSLYGLIFGGQKDTITLEIALSELPTCVFYMAPKKSEKDIELTCPDVRKFAAKYETSKESSWVPSNKILYTDSRELANGNNKVFVQLMLQLKQNEDLFESLYFSSDHNKIYPGHHKSIRFVFKLPSGSEEMKKLAQLIQLVMVFIDTLPKLRLERDQEETNQKRRRKAREDADRLAEKLKNEELEKLRTEKKKQEEKKRQEDKKKKLETKKSKSTGSGESKNPKAKVFYS